MQKNSIKILFILFLFLFSTNLVFAKNFVINNVSNSNQHYFHVEGSNGRVGIATSSPTTELDVNGSVNISKSGSALYFPDGTSQTTAATGTIDGSGTANYVPYFSDSDTLTDSTIYTDGTNIGIGTTTLTGDLSLNSDGGVELAFVGSSSGNIYSYTGTDFYIGTDDANKLRFITNNSDRLTIANNGYVGINDTTPSFELDVTGDAYIKNRLAIGDSGPSDFYGIRLNEVQTDTSTTATMGIRVDSDITTTLTGNKNHYGSYVISDAQINQDGNTGSLYGTYNLVRNDPSSEGDNLTNLFAISGHAQARGTGTVTAVRGGDFDVSTEDSTASITTAYGVDSLVHTDAGGQINNGYGGYFRVLDEGSMSNAYGVYSRVYESGGDITVGNAFYADCDDATTCYGLRIVAGDAEVTTDWGIYETGADKHYLSAPIGLGVTTPTELLDLNGNLSIRGGSGSSTNNLVLRHDESLGISSISSDSSGDSILTFETASSGTSSERLRIDKDGNVGIGTSSPSSTLDLASGHVTLPGFDSTSDRVIDFGSGYGIFADNAGAGTNNSRLWFNSPDQGEIVLGPRGGSDYLDQVRVRAEVISLEGGSVGINDSSPDGGLTLDVEGDIGADDYCDENGANCFKPEENTAGATCSDGGTRDHLELYTTSTSQSCGCGGSQTVSTLKQCKDGTVFNSGFTSVGACSGNSCP